MSPLLSESQNFMPLFHGLTPGIDAKGRIGPVALLWRVVAKIASYTALPAESGTIFTNRGATGTVTITLPAVVDSAGCFFAILAAAAYAFAATAPASTLVADGNASATTITFQTAAHIIGGMALLFCDGVKWYEFAAGNLSAIPTIT